MGSTTGQLNLREEIRRIDRVRAEIYERQAEISKLMAESSIRQAGTPVWPVAAAALIASILGGVIVAAVNHLCH